MTTEGFKLEMIATHLMVLETEKSKIKYWQVCHLVRTVLYLCFLNSSYFLFHLEGRNVFAHFSEERKVSSDSFYLEFLYQMTILLTRVELMT